MQDCLAASGVDPLFPLLFGFGLLVVGLAVVFARSGASRRARGGALLGVVVCLALAASMTQAAPAQALGPVGSSAECASGPESSAAQPPVSSDGTSPAPTAPGSTGANRSLPFTVSGVPATASVVVKRVWGGPRDVNSCVFERGAAPYTDEQVFRPGGADGMTISGSVSWETIASGSCFFDPTTVSWDVEFWDRGEKVDHWRMYAIDNTYTDVILSGGLAALAAVLTGPAGVVLVAAGVVTVTASGVGLGTNTHVRLTAPENPGLRGPIVATTATSTDANGALAYRWDRSGDLSYSTSVLVAPSPGVQIDSVTAEARYQDACTTYDGPFLDQVAPLNRDEGGLFWEMLTYTQYVAPESSCNSNRRAIASWTITARTTVDGVDTPVAAWEITNWSLPSGRNGSGCAPLGIDGQPALSAPCRTSAGAVTTVQEPFTPEDEIGWILSVRP